MPRRLCLENDIPLLTVVFCYLFYSSCVVTCRLTCPILQRRTAERRMTASRSWLRWIWSRPKRLLSCSRNAQKGNVEQKPTLNIGTYTLAPKLDTYIRKTSPAYFLKQMILYTGYATGQLSTHFGSCDLHS